jgi:hypothetical protein
MNNVQRNNTAQVINQPINLFQNKAENDCALSLYMTGSAGRTVENVSTRMALKFVELDQDGRPILNSPSGKGNSGAIYLTAESCYMLGTALSFAVAYLKNKQDNKILQVINFNKTKLAVRVHQGGIFIEATTGDEGDEQEFSYKFFSHKVYGNLQIEMLKDWLTEYRVGLADVGMLASKTIAISSKSSSNHHKDDDFSSMMGMSNDSSLPDLPSDEDLESTIDSKPANISSGIDSLRASFVATPPTIVTGG